jgi:hypothetical protein
MAKPRKASIRKQRPARVSRKMAAGRPYDLGFKPPPHPNAETGEGEPEVNG